MSGRVRPWLAALACAMLQAAPAVAQTEPSPNARPSAAAPVAAPSAEERLRREETLRSLEQTARASAESRQRLEQEVAGLKADRAKLAAALVATAHRARAAEERVQWAEQRLDGLLAEEAGLRRALEGRRAVLAEILVALQRLGRHPPPAVLARVEDILDAVRSAMLLGSVMPGLREEARRIAGELARLGQVRAAIAADRTALAAEYASLAGERDRIAALVAARQERLAGAEADIGRERSRSERIGSQVRTLRDLLDRMEQDEARTRRRAEEARQESEAEARRAEDRFASAALREPVRLTPRQAFPELRGSLIRPAVGPVLREFGTPDGSGGVMRGSAIGPRPRALVTAPSDGTVIFAGSFRSYGRVLIINAGGGYYFLLAGMDGIQVDVGQFVLAGEPVARMGEVAAPSAALGVVEGDGPVLYVELRKDGGAIDPGPWWAKSQGERARG